MWGVAWARWCTGKAVLRKVAGRGKHGGRGVGDLVNHVLELSLRGVLAERAHDLDGEGGGGVRGSGGWRGEQPQGYGQRAGKGGGGRYSAKLLGGDSAVTILVEKGESLLELSNLLLSKLVCAPHNVGVASQRREEQI